MIDWLNDAYAMERSLEVMLRKQAANEDVHHAIRERARIHLDETEVHAERVAECLEMLGSTPSTIKSAAGQAMELAKGMMTKMASDERVKDFLCATAPSIRSGLLQGAHRRSLRRRRRGIVPILEKNLKETTMASCWIRSQCRRPRLFIQPSRACRRSIAARRPQSAVPLASGRV